MTRGLVLPLTALQRRNRMLYLAGELPLAMLDSHVRRSRQEMLALEGYDLGGLSERADMIMCPTLYYLLKEHNGGKDPCAPDPATRWRKPRIPIIRPNPALNRTCDCIGGMAWAGGWDRYQPVRFAHIYKGWVNTDSMRLDAAGPRRCFRPLERPEPGCYVVYASDPHKKTHGVRVGHIAGVVDVPAEYAPEHREWWQQLGCVDVGDRGSQRANRRRTGELWWRKDAMFIVPTMTP